MMVLEAVRSLLGNATPFECAFVVGVALLMPLLRWVLDTYVLQPVALWLLVPANVRASGAVPDKMRKKASKLTESLWKTVMYVGFILWGLHCARSEPWFRDSRHFWLGWPNQDMGAALRLYFGVQLGFYLAGVVMLATWEVRRKDFHVMMTHHLITVVLITATYTHNFVRSGCMTLLLHDVNDLLMEVAKSFKYCRCDGAATATFAVFTLSWAGLRLYLFPFHIIRSTLYESKEIIGYLPPHYYTINAGLIALVCIHIWWFHLILRIVFDTLRTGRADDVREDGSDDSQ